jgi:hypothetical protein
VKKAEDQAVSAFMELVNNRSVKNHPDKRQRDRYRSNPSWHGLRLANMPKKTGLILLALLLGAFLAVMLRK